jgi:arylsulfatase A-like enzyme
MRASRREKLVIGFVAAACLVAVGLGYRTRQGGRPVDFRRVARGKNLLLIIVDTLRADRLRCYGYGEAHTPTLDSLAQRGVLFENAFAQITTTVPSHASIMTSLYPKSHGIYGNDGVLPAAATTLAEVMEGAGYATGAVVGVSFVGRGSGLGQGFDSADAPRVVRRATEVTTLAVEWLRRHADDRFFLWVHYYDPHLPYDPPYRFRRPEPTYEGRFQTRITIAGMRAITSGRVPLPNDEELGHVDMLYDGEVAYVDDEIGRLLHELASWELADETVVVLTADHGESHGEHAVYFDHVGLYEPTARVPLLLVLPRLALGRRVPALTQTIDIMPTVLELLGLSVPGGLEGVSLLPALECPGIEVNRAAYSEHNDGALAAVRTSAWKLILGLKHLYFRRSWQRHAGQMELYDLREDPGETVDAGPLGASQRTALAKDLRSWLREGEPRWGRRRRLDDQTEKVLRELGYLQ